MSIFDSFSNMSRMRAIIYILLGSTPAFATAQTPNDFFPHHIGNRWDYLQMVTGEIRVVVLTRDSIGADNSHNLFYNNQPTPTYKIDTLYNVFRDPQTPYTYLRYKLSADSCTAWQNPNSGSTLWAWVARSDSTEKDFKYAPGNPCSLGSLQEDRLWNGVGLYYTYREPDDVWYLTGCIINGDTIGFLTSVERNVNYQIPTDFELNQNYPNPFNPQTTISFSLPHPAFTTLILYTTIGEQVATLVSTSLNAGTYSAQWNARDVAGGIYYYRLTAGEFVKTKKLILLR